ncbi:MAG: dihydrodipicolinate synthase family protein [Chloroflexota bacterium]
MDNYTLDLPFEPNQTKRYTLREPLTFDSIQQSFESRIAFAAVHVVADPNADHTNTDKPAQIDWDATLAYRHHLWDLGFSVAEAMDTAQRGMGLDWTASQELISRSVSAAKSVNGGIACGAGTDHILPDPSLSIDDVIAAYEEQVEFVEHTGGRIILMASRALAAVGKNPDDYARVYGHILSQIQHPVILHWLGDMFDPQLAGYWGSSDLDAATDTCLAIIAENEAKIDGIKLSLLDDQREIDLRRRLPASVKMYTGDDFNYPSLILGDEQGYSHALLGIFDAIAPVAAAAFHALDEDDIERYNTLMEPTVPLSRHIFQTPTFHYKTGIVFLAYLNGHQDHFKMVGAQETSRSREHLAELFMLADQAGLLRDPELAVTRMNAYLTG